MDGTGSRSRRILRLFAFPAITLTALFAGTAGAAQPQPAVLGSSQAHAYMAVDSPYLWLLIVLLLLQSVAIALLLRNNRRQRKTEVLLRGSEERYRTLVDGSLVPIYRVDQDEIIQYANRTLCAMFGYQQDDLVGKKSFRAIMAPDDVPRVAGHIGRLISGLEEPSRCEARGLHRNGELIDIEILASVVRYAEKSVAIGALLDISRRKRLEILTQQQQLMQEKLNRTLELRIEQEVDRNREKDKFMLQQSRFAAMGEMIGNIAHQWRQPLNKLGIVMQRMQMEQEKGVMTDRLMEERVADGMNLLLSLSRTIDDFRNFFRPDLDPAPFSLAGAVSRTVAFFEASCADHDIKISIEGDSNLIYNGHVVQFRQALLNILNNARDALLDKRPLHPLISVGIRDEEHRSVLTVRDNAGGIDPEIIDKIFDPYFTTRGKGNRTGVGLYMAKTIIDQDMQGRIMVRNLDGGAEFRIVV